MSRAVVAWVMAAFVAFAGCVKSDAKPDAASGASSVVNVGSGDDTETGSVEGTIVDESLQPIVGAQVALTDLKAQAQTDAAGTFGFQQVPAGAHKLAAVALGFDSVGKNVDVVAGQPTRVSVTLHTIAIKQGYLEVIGPLPGYVNCTFGTPVVAGVCPAVGTVAGGEKSSFTFRMHNETTHFVGELRWTQGSAATSRYLGSTFSYNGRSNTHWWCFGSSPPPHVKWLYSMSTGNCTTTGRSTQQVPSGSPKRPNETMTLQSFVSIPFTQVGNASDPLPVHVALEQKFEIVFTLFQNYDEGTVPAEYTAFPD